MATAVGLAMKITADLSSFHNEMKKSNEDFGQFKGSMDGVQDSTALLNRVVELLTMQLELMAQNVIDGSENFVVMSEQAEQTTNVMDRLGQGAEKLAGIFATLAQSSLTLATAYTTLFGQAGLVRAAISGTGSALGFLAKTAIKAAATRVFHLVTGLGATVTALNAVGFAAAAAAPGLKSLESFTERLNIEATKLGTSFAFVQVLEVAASRSGESIDSLRIAFTALLRNIEAARDGAKGSIDSFNKLGISVKDLESQSPEDIFKRTAAALQEIDDPATKAATALKVLGENGARLLPSLRSIGQADEELLRFSADLDRLDIKRLDDLGRGADQLQTAFSGLGRQLILPFAGMVEGVEKALADVIGGISAVISPLGDALTPFLDLIGLLIQAVGGLAGIILKVIASVLEPFAHAFRLAGEAVELLSDGLDYLFQKVDDGFQWWADFFGLADFENINKGAKEAADAVEEITTATQVYADEISKAATAAADFGQAGFDAALKYQESLEEINALKEEGEYTEEQAAEAAKRANEIFEERIDLLKQQAEEQKKIAEEARKAAEADQKRIESFRQSGLSAEERAQEEAAQTVLAIQREQARIEQEIAAARAAGDQAAVNAGAERLAQLEQEEARAADIASGEAARREKQSQKDQEYQAKLDDMRAEFVRNEIKRQEQIAGKQDEYNEKLAEMEKDRLEELSKVNQKALQASDIRSGGIAQVIALATGREDPAIEESRKQRKQLEKIADEIKKLGGTVEIVGAA